jgi:hypothetical protein
MIAQRRYEMLDMNTCRPHDDVGCGMAVARMSVDVGKVPLGPSADPLAPCLRRICLPDH